MRTAAGFSRWTNEMSAELETDVLKGVSRSFYLSLRLLPAAMRRPASVAYLLARLSDTLADSVSASGEQRLGALHLFSRQLRGVGVREDFGGDLLEGVGNASERLLLKQSSKLLAAFESLDTAQRDLIGELLETIISGQVMDLERFGKGDGKVRVMESAQALDDYTWRVAGCVGLFWTRLGFLTLGARFSNENRQLLEERAVDYGKGLQLVNILRDLPEDRRSGRCYLPVADPSDGEAMLAEFRHWRGIAAEKISCGRRYSETLCLKRLRVASAMPAAIAEQTMALLDVSSISALEPRIKVSRRRVQFILLRESLFG